MTAVGESADVVDAVDVIRVIMREENGIDSAHAGGNELEAQLGRSVLTRFHAVTD